MTNLIAVYLGTCGAIICIIILHARTYEMDI